MSSEAIQVNIYIWCLVKVQIFDQHITQVPNHQFSNHLIIKIFWNILILDIKVNTQKFSQVVSHSLKPSDTPYNILSEGYFSHSNLQQIQTWNISIYLPLLIFLVNILCSWYIQERDELDPVPESIMCCFSHCHSQFWFSPVFQVFREI